MAGIDFETWCESDLKKVGLYNYINHPSFRPVLIGAYLDDGTRDYLDLLDNDWTNEQWVLGVLRFIGQSSHWAAHNAGFEIAVVNWIRRKFKAAAGRRYTEPAPSFTDTAVISRTAGSVSRLERAAPQLLFQEAKLDPGGRLVKKFGCGEEPHVGWRGTPDWLLYIDYCLKDAELSSKLADLGYNGENRNFDVTHAMNEKGWFVDLPALEAMDKMSEDNKAIALADFQHRHDPEGKLNLNSSQQLIKWAAERGIRATSFDEQSVEEMLAKLEKRYPDPFDMPENHRAVYDLLVTKQVIGGSALKKLDVIRRTVSADGRLRNQYIHAGAGQTHRTSGAGAQMQNLKRLRNPIDMDKLVDGTYAHIANEDLATNIRQLFKAEHPQGELIVGDFSSVESRGLAWLAREDWKIQAYWDGKDVYKMLADKKYKVGYDNIDKDQRTFGKVGELSCGYGAGPVAVAKFAKGMHVELAPAEASDTVYSWRDANQMIVQFWAALEEALDKALAGGEGIVPVGLEDVGHYLRFTSRAALPSIGALHAGTRDVFIEFDGPNLWFTRVFRGVYRRGNQVVYHKPSDINSGPEWKDSWKKQETVNGVKRWTSGFFTLYGGKMAGIITQSLCREIFFKVLNNVHRALDDIRSFQLIGKFHDEDVPDDIKSLQLIGQFHDEIVLEWTPTEGGFTLLDAKDFLREHMTESILFGFPLDAEVNSDHRYIK